MAIATMMAMVVLLSASVRAHAVMALCSLFLRPATMALRMYAVLAM